jgi:FKBP-type peptidyl-prolyl cis-trans isomerase 2
MQVGLGTIMVDYTLRLDSGEVVDSSGGGVPRVVHFGRGRIVPGLPGAA